MNIDTTVRLGAIASEAVLSGPVARRREMVARAWDGGIRHLFVADHVSFHTGWGVDGLINSALVTALHDQMAMYVGVYLLALRHPLPVARQLATLSEAAPGRIILGVGVGGEDPHEFEICGVNPRTRGRRTDESLSVLRPLLAGETVTHTGEFYDFDSARITPTPTPAVPIMIGGRVPAALQRVARHGDGWLGIWATPEQYARRLAEVAAHAERIGRTDLPTDHGLQLWAAVDNDKAAARERLASRMENMYRIPFDRFERFSPHGSVTEVAEALAPYVEAGCRHFNVSVVGATPEGAIDDLVAVGEALGLT